MTGAVYIGWVECSAAVETKIQSKHNVTLVEVREAVQWPSRPMRAAWLSDDRGARLAVEGATYAGRRIKAVLYAVDDDEGTWRLGTAVAT